LRLYFDTAYIAKCYLNEPDAKKVRKVAAAAAGLYSSAWSIPELASVFHRHVREGSLSVDDAAELRQLLLDDVQEGVWVLLPVSDPLLYRVAARASTVSPTVYFRAGDAVHLFSAQEAGFAEIWTNDRHLLAAAPHFGLKGRSV
jgi:predicted nucleic acid-binding protein